MYYNFNALTTYANYPLILYSIGSTVAKLILEFKNSFLLFFSYVQNSQEIKFIKVNLIFN